MRRAWNRSGSTDAGIPTNAPWRGRRYTDERTLAIAEHTLIKSVNQPICTTLHAMGVQAMGLHSLSSCAVFAEPLRLENDP
ncbi:MAG: hypothetical protein ACYTFU_09100 [Planctomycetota bacterium]|jgi:acetylglutamate kinase